MNITKQEIEQFKVLVKKMFGEIKEQPKRACIHRLTIDLDGDNLAVRLDTNKARIYKSLLGGLLHVSEGLSEEVSSIEGKIKSLDRENNSKKISLDAIESSIELTKLLSPGLVCATSEMSPEENQAEADSQKEAEVDSR